MRRLMHLFVGILAGVMCLFSEAVAQPLPVDPALRVGRLENGMTYYVRANQKPAKQADFYILHNVGAIQEEDSQQGLAHFLEHMAFNGTVNFPKKNLINYLETIGVKFGANLNAFTSMEVTCYNISNVPMLREPIIDSALLILHDWSHFIALEEAEIDAERGVIIEELRTRNTASRRINEQQAPTVYNNSKYAERNIIGHLEGLRSFHYDEIRDFYHRWYRPDLQAVIVVGDFDPDQMVEKIRRVMSDIPAVENPEPKRAVEVPFHEETKVVFASDAEQTVLRGNLMIKRKATPIAENNTLQAERQSLALSMLRFMSGLRFQEVQQRPDSPFMEASFGNNSLTSTCDMLFGSYLCRDGRVMEGFEAFYTEIERIRRFGFTPAEFNLAQKQMMSGVRQTYVSSVDRRNNYYVRRYMAAFRANIPVFSAEDEWKTDSLLVNEITLDEVNRLAGELITEQNAVVAFALPEREMANAPSKEAILAKMKEIGAKELAAPVNREVKNTLLPDDVRLKRTKVRKSETDRFGATVWELKNGAKVIAMPTKHAADDVLAYFTSEGGTSIVSDEDYMTAYFLADIMQTSGVADMNKIELRHRLAGKNASISPLTGEFHASFSGSCSPKDLESLLQLFLLQMTRPRFNENDFETLVSQNVTYYKNRAKDPRVIYADSVAATLYPNDSRALSIKAEDMEKIDFERLAPLHEQLFSGIQNYQLYFVGDFDLDELKPLVERYIGSIPATKERRTWFDRGNRMPKGEHENRFSAEMRMPKTSVMFAFSGEMAYTPENQLTINALSQVMRMRYTQKIREEKGGSYGVGCSGSLRHMPAEEYLLRVAFDTNKEQSDELMHIVTDELADFAKVGPTEEDIDKIRKFLLKQYDDQMKSNTTWIYYLRALHRYGQDNYSDYHRLIEELSPEKVRAMAAKIVADGNVARIVMDPKVTE